MFIKSNLINKPIFYNNFFKSNVQFLENSTSIIKHSNDINNVNYSNNIYDFLPGFGLGFPLNILQLGYTYLHYDKSIITPELIFLQFCIGIFTYGTDRFLDSENYNLKDSKELINLSEKKREYYLYLQNNKITTLSIILVSYIYILDELLIEHKNLRLLFYILTSTIYYKTIKQNFGRFKAIYIATLWTLDTTILPSIIYENNFNILRDPIIYMSSFFLLFGSSNLMDIEDIDEDREENIETLPVVYGKEKTQYISYLSLIISIGLILEKIFEKYENEIVSYILIT